jgi:hypothetical protein
VFVKALRVGLGQLIIFIDFITRPGKKKRPVPPLRLRSMQRRRI